MFEVNRRTILRDIEFLRDRLCAPLEYNASRKGYFFTKGFTLMPPLHLSDDDLLTLDFLQQCIARYEGTEIGIRLKQSFNHMFGSLAATRA